MTRSSEILVGCYFWSRFSQVFGRCFKFPKLVPNMYISSHFVIPPIVWCSSILQVSFFNEAIFFCLVFLSVLSHNEQWDHMLHLRLPSDITHLLTTLAYQPSWRFLYAINSLKLFFAYIWCQWQKLVLGSSLNFSKDSLIPILIYQNQLFENVENRWVIEYIPNLITDGHLSLILQTTQHSF